MIINFKTIIVMTVNILNFEISKESELFYKNLNNIVIIPILKCT